MALSVYVHIPYCLQRCRYCDFTTFEQSEILPPDKYTRWVLEEIRQRHHFWPDRKISTLYFGGGTPSLIAPEHIVAITRELANVGFTFLDDCEKTIEINPATINEDNLKTYFEVGINRFSVGAQTFNDRLLQLCGRKHNSKDTRHTLEILQKHNLNYSFDLLFALPSQTLAELTQDLDEVAKLDPPHLSAYCLTVPEGHPMASGRAPEAEQVEMFDLIESRLKERGILKYEISNFAKPGFESKHNMVYWNDQNYWGLGLSAHSYDRNSGANGMRFWNPKSLDLYGQQVALKGSQFLNILPADQRELLETHEALTDFCHMHLRTTKGLHQSALRNRFSEEVLASLWPRLNQLCQSDLLVSYPSHWALSQKGSLVSNLVFEKLTFLRSDLPLSTLTISH